MNENPSDEEIAQHSADNDRATHYVDNDEPPHLPFPVVGIGASAGGLESFIDFFKAMPPDSGLAFVLVQHLPPERESLLVDILARHTTMVVHEVRDGMRVEPNSVYAIKPGHTLTICKGLLHLGERLQRPMHTRPVDDFFKSLAEEQRERAICIIMSGMGSNGTAGAQAVKAVGGLCIAQDPEAAQYPSMPRHLIDAGYADYVLTADTMPSTLIAYAAHPYARGDGESPQELATREQHQLREVLAILRTRSKKDFSGYKQPTVLRRIQRRMGLCRIATLGEYARHLRQNPTEVTGLSDDLLIHVTGFFRDPDAWEVLRQRVIVPLIAGRESDTALRCWVTACSSGEEAYTLAMLLVEEADRAGKHFDIKVFATDMAERTLQNARQGLYPGGIEAEITPDRLARFFQQEDALYRIRQDLRERVVFAPHNLLQDPPFSRLDIISCRNLLIYLEPEIQVRVLSLLHFGLREGGTLFLGASETVTDSAAFEPIDRRARLFRRLGPTRHGTVDIPGPASTFDREFARIESRTTNKTSLAQLTGHALLTHHLPAAVTVDREFRIVYFHGQTELFLTHPRGEATRDLMALLRDGVRIAARVALQRSVAQNVTVLEPDGWADVHGKRHRIAVTASPLETATASGLFVLSFQDRGEIALSQAEPTASAETEEDVTAGQLRRIRDELQSTIEELQTSNEELRASHEEVVSVNEELQSTNEELETGREEMQSLNEELTTVNAQLQTKIEEHEAARNDLASLLTSTDIAVLFLDARFRIRRFTPTAKDLVELIATDIGRPLNDLSRKFHDPELLTQAETVLQTLIPIEREIDGGNGRWYLRRILPYRTADNRIDGVVITFVNISDRKQAEELLRLNEQRLRELSESLELQVQARSQAMVVLRDIATAANQAMSIDVALQAAIDRICEVRKWIVGHAWLVVEETQCLTSSGIWRISTNEVSGAELSLADFRQSSETLRLNIQDDFVGRVARTGEIIWCEDVERVPRWTRSHPHRYGFQSAVALPISMDNNIVGVLEFYSESHAKKDERFLEIAPSIAVQLGHVFERKRLEREVAMIADQEQQRMGQEMHDGLSQQIAGIAMLAGGLAENLRNVDTSLHEKATTLREAAQDAKRQSRILTKGLMPVEVAPDGLMHALQDLAERTQQTYGIACIFECVSPVPVSNSFVATHLYRIASEAVHNAVKHAQPKHIWIQLRQSLREELIVRDDGVGFGDKSAVETHGDGLRIMRHRAGLIGARLSIEAGAERGTVLTCTLNS
ncbi:chemotaxis protein CheB [Anatilimnocola floriformis]|uniref:chemotaxis protein CheB n=1 Tax=Anatilimnocola floriformis TaxID=2948575 RepID=UPI0020C25749|nr:chemotaxis protein CheB [Anatilimnocola floriformis]